MKTKTKITNNSLRISMKLTETDFFPLELEKGNSVWIPQADCNFLSKKQVL